MTTTLPTTCDVLVIGGGVVGLSIAYELANRNRETNIVVVDRKTPGLEASWAGAGILPPGSWYDDHTALEQLAALSGKLNHKWSRRLTDATGIDNQLKVVGALHLATNPAQQDKLQAKFERWRKLDIEVVKLELDQIVHFEPQLCTDNCLAAYHVPAEAQIDNRRHCQALVAACEAMGVRNCHPAEVSRMVRAGDHVERVETTAGAIVAKQVVLAAGAWSPAVAESVDWSLPVRPVRGQMLSFGPLAEPPLRGIVHRGDQYIVPRDDGRLLVGSTVEDVGFDKSTTRAASQSLADFARQLIPALEEHQVADHWAGLRPASADLLPYIGRVPGVHNTFVAAGHYRSGLQMASGTAVALADQMTGVAPRVSLEPFRLDR